MVDQKFGKSDWNEEIKARQNTPMKKDTFMRLQDGSNVLRVVTEPYQYLAFKYKEKDDPGFGDKINASLPLEKDPLHLRGHRAKRRWLVGVINRRTQAYELLDISVQVYKAIQNFIRDEDYGDPKGYDLDIKVDRNGGPTGYYGVVAKPPKALSANDLQVIQTVDLEALARRCTPPTAEQVKGRVNALREKKGLHPLNWDEVVATATTVTPSVSAVDMSDDAEAFDFPAHDAQ